MWYSDNLISRNAKKSRFANKLYTANGDQVDVGSVQQQRFVEEPTITVVQPRNEEQTITETHQDEQQIEAARNNETGHREVETIENNRYNDFQFWHTRVNNLKKQAISRNL